MIRNILVTGGAGFIGSNLSEALSCNGDNVIVLDNFSTGKMENLEGFKKEIIHDEMDTVTVLQNYLKQYSIEYVLHQAAIPSVIKSVENPHRNVGNNINSTLNLFEAVRRYKKVKKVVVASSSSVYGDSLKLPKTETDPTDPISPYALSKYFTEKIALQYGKFYEIPVISLRYFNVYGPRQDSESPYSAVIVKFIRNIMNDRPVEIYGDGKQTRDFTFIDDVVNANIKAMESSVQCDFMNIGSGKKIDLNDLVAVINKILKKDIEIIYKDKRPGDVLDSLASIEKAKDLIGYTPEFSIEKGIGETIKWGVVS